MDTVAQREALHALRTAFAPVVAAFGRSRDTAEVYANVKAYLPSLETAMRNVEAAGVRECEAYEELVGRNDAPAFMAFMGAFKANLHRAGAKSRRAAPAAADVRVRPAVPVDTAAMRKALCRLKVAVATANDSCEVTRKAALETALHDAVKADFPAPGSPANLRRRSCHHGGLGGRRHDRPAPCGSASEPSECCRC